MAREIAHHQQSSEPLSHGDPIDKGNRMIADNLQSSEGTAPKIVSFPKDNPTPGHEPVELRPLLNDLVLKVLPVIRDQKVRFSFDVAGGLPQVRGNSSDLRRAFSDIIRNALDSMPQGGRLSVSVSYYAADGLPERVEVRIENQLPTIPGELKGETLKSPFTAEPPFQDRAKDLAVAQNALARAGGSLALKYASGFGLSCLVTLEVFTERELAPDKPEPR